MVFKQVVLLSLLTVLSLHIKISHDQMSYRMGQNYGAGGQDPNAVSNCDINIPKVPEIPAPVILPPPVQPVPPVILPPPVIQPPKPSRPVESVDPIFEPVAVPPLIISCTLPRVLNRATNTCECLSQTVFDPQTNQCLCPPQKPLWNGKQCVKCSDNMYFDAQQRQCYLCPQGFVHTMAYGNKFRCDSAL